MKILIKVIYIIILFILFSCEEEERRISLDETFVLKYGETKLLNGQDHFSVSFVELLGDSRCPANAICVWEGQASVGIEIHENYETRRADLVNGAMLDDQSKRINIGHYTIELLRVIPFPEKSGVVAKESDYSIQLVITSN